MSGRRKSRRPQRRFTDVVEEDMERVGVTEEDAGCEMEALLRLKNNSKLFINSVPASSWAKSHL